MTRLENSPLFLAQPSRFGQTLVQQTPFERDASFLDKAPGIGLDFKCCHTRAQTRRKLSGSHAPSVTGAGAGTVRGAAPSASDSIHSVGSVCVRGTLDGGWWSESLPIPLVAVAPIKQLEDQPTADSYPASEPDVSERGLPNRDNRGLSGTEGSGMPRSEISGSASRPT